jgi:hypothetical protein
MSLPSYYFFSSSCKLIVYIRQFAKMGRNDKRPKKPIPYYDKWNKVFKSFAEGLGT